MVYAAPSAYRSTAREHVTESSHPDRAWVELGYDHRAVFEGVSFDGHRGEILAIVGPNGSGKTTLLRTILGLLKPLRGQVERQAGLSISYVPQRDRIDTILPITALGLGLVQRPRRVSSESLMGWAYATASLPRRPRSTRSVRC